MKADDKFTIGSLDLFLSDQTNGFLPTGTGTLTIVGRLEGANQFTISKNSGFPTTATVNNGYFTVNFATDGSANYSNVNIDELTITIGGGFIEVDIDNFNFCEAVPDVDNQAPAIQSLTIVGTPESTAGTVDFQAVFNEIAQNVTLDDFSLHATGTATGSLIGITGSGTTYTLQVTGISGEGTLQVRLKSGTDIKDALNNTPPIEYVNGQLHFVGACYVETFESRTDGVTTFVSNGKDLSLGGNWAVNRQNSFGINASDVFLLGAGSGPYTLNIDDGEVAFTRLALYLSSDPAGAMPTNSGTLTIRGKKGSSTVYEITKNTGFPSDFGTTNGYFFVDFAIDGTDDYSGVFVDKLEIEVTGFVYLALDNLGFCSDFEAPAGYTVAIDHDPITAANQTAVSFTFAGAEVGATYQYSFTGIGGTPVTGSGTVTSATQQVTGIDLTGLDQGTVTLSVTLTDASGNVGVAATNTATKIINNNPTNITLDTDPASINQGAGANAVIGTLTSADADAGDTFTYTLVSGTGDEDNAGFNISGTSLRATNPLALFAGTNSVRIRTTDNKGGTYEKAFTITVVDNVAPTVSSVNVMANATYVAGQHLDFTVNVSENVTVTGTPSLSLTIGSTPVNATYRSGSTTNALLFRYTIQAGDVDTDGIDVTGTSIVLNGGTIRDGANQPLVLMLNNIGTTTGILVDAVAPTVSISSDKTSLKGGETATLTFTLSEASTNFTLADITGSGVTLSGFSGTGTSYTATLTPPANSTLTATIDVNGGTFTDAVGNGNTAATQLTITVDTEAPTVSISSDKTSLKSGETAALTFTLSEASANFEAGDVTASGGTLSDFSGSGTSYSATFTPSENATITATVDVNAGTFTDAVGNANTAATQQTIAIDTESPSGYAVSIDQATITLANYTSLSFTFSAAEVGAAFGYEITSSSGGTPVTGSGTITAVGQQLSNIDVSSLPNGTLTLSVTLTDVSGNEGNPATDNVTKAVNYPPDVTTSGGITAFTESVSGSPVPVPIDGALTISDPDNTTLASATVTIAGNFQSGQDILAFVNDGNTMGNVSGSYSAATLTLTSSGTTATLAEWEAALRAVTYSNTSSTPNTGNRTISFVVNDGIDDSTPGTKTVSVQAVNNAPIVTNVDGNDVTFIENGAAILIDAGGDATVSDSDSPDFDGGNLTVAVVANEVAGEDIVGIRNEGMAAGQIGVIGFDVHYGGTHIGLFVGGTGGVDLIVTFLPTATPAAVQALIRNLTYRNSNTTNPSVDPRAIRITLNDGDGATSLPGDVTVAVTAVNDAPAVATSGGATIFTEPEDGDLVPEMIDLGLTVTDPDNTTLASATVRISSGSFQIGEDVLAFENDGSTMGNIDGSYDEATGTIALSSTGASATLAEWQAALRAVTYHNSSQHPNTTTRTVSFEVNDGMAISSPATKDILVVAVNTAPVAVNDPVTVTEDIPTTGNVLTNDSDVEGNVLTASLVTAPVNGTVVLNADGSFTYTPNGNYIGLDSLEYQACDNGTPSRCDTAWVHFIIAAVNDAPLITAPATLAADEDVLTDLTGISFADVDAGSADVTATFSVGSGTLAAISGGGVAVSGSETTALTLVGTITDVNVFIAAGNVGFTTALDATDDVTLTVHIDDGGNTGTDPGNSGTADSEAATTTVTITVTAQNDAPINTVPADQTINQGEPLVFSKGNGNSISVSDVDAGGNMIQVTLSATNGLVTLGSTTGLIFTNASGVDNVTMTFQGTIADINNVFEGITFAPASGYNGAASLQMITDDLGSTGQGGNQIATDIVNIQVIDVVPPAVPSGLTAASGIGQVVLRWIANTDADLDSYKVYGGTQPNPTTEIANIAAPSSTFTHIGLSNGTVYYYRVTALDDVGNESFFSAGISALPMAQQEITFGPLADVTYGDSPLVLSATASSGSEVIYASSEPEIASISGNTLIIHGAGSVVITASQSGDASTTPAMSVSQTLVIHKAVLTGITFEGNSFVYDGIAKSLKIEGTLPVGANIAYTNNDQTNAGSYVVNAIVTGSKNYVDLILNANLIIEEAEFKGLSFNDETFTYTNKPQSLVLDNAPTGSQINYIGNNQTDAGAYSVEAKITHPNYKEKILTANLVIKKATQQIIFDEIGTVSRDVGRIALKVKSSSGLPVTIIGNDDLVAVVDDNDLLVHRLGTVRLTASQDGDKNHEAAKPVTIIVHVVDIDDGPVRVHQALSPNGDGINDFMIIEGIKDYPDNKLSIFAPSGLRVFTIDDYDNDSKVFRGVGNFSNSDGGTLPQGTYFYVLEYQDKGARKIKKGWFVLKM